MLCTWVTLNPFSGLWDPDGTLTFVHRSGDSCAADATADCDTEEQKGAPPTLSCVGNPINIAIGNKYQREDDYVPVGGPNRGFSRFYNSVDGVWRHTYATHLRLSLDKWALIKADGQEFYFTANAGDPWSGGTALTNNGSYWEWASNEGERFRFDASGRLINWRDPSGAEQNISYADGQAVVTNDLGQTLTFTEDDLHQPLTLTTGALKITYDYNMDQRLVQVNREWMQGVTHRQYVYEDPRNTGLLTGIVDERGVRFATWAYDAQWRAVSSEHAGGAERTVVAYNADESRTVTNELGKSATYRFVTVGKIKHVSAIEGEPSPSCPASNSTYTYNDSGQMLTKTDAKGLVTTYSYNSRGLETSRTEASGTPLARTVTTEWDPTLVLKTRVVEPTRTTVYTYDAQGRQLNQQTTSN
ncbi:RHS repeat protein [Pseudomonas gingeri]|uniref:RHS repeat protein n=1 Tax=Pseudomonas gingeri TaxID=117681 RepID=A0A7Y7XJ29_9PSED|nr:DUF6531 domain-containing protein [Pseudomonas gingeri]NWC00540.1 RHS repeat protein [Pseudomonas gingeri]